MHWFDTIKQDLTSKCQLIASNVAGPTRPIYIADAKLLELTAWGNAHHGCLIIIIQTYNGVTRMHISSMKGMGLSYKTFIDEFDTVLQEEIKKAQ